MLDVKLVLNQAEENMEATLLFLDEALAHIRAGKANPRILDGIKVDYYGSHVPLANVSTVTTPDAKTITVQPWEKAMLPVIEKAILNSGVGITPMNNGEVIRLAIPPLTEERRKEFVKLVKKFGEDSKIAIRNIRRDANEHLKKKQKDEKISEDLLKEAETKVQKATNEHIAEIDQILVHKEKEIMEV